MTTIVKDVAIVAIPFLAWLTFRGSMERIVEGFLWRIKCPYKKGSIIFIEGYWAHIEHIGLFKTDLTVYRWDSIDAKPAQSMTWTINNMLLHHLTIMSFKNIVPVELISKTSFKPPISSTH